MGMVEGVKGTDAAVSRAAWLRYRPVIPAVGVAHQPVPICQESTAGPVFGVLTAQSSGTPSTIVICCPGVFPCAEGPGCIYNDLASILPTANVATLQMNYRPPGTSLKDATRDILDILRTIAQKRLYTTAVPVVLIGWSMGAAACIEAASRSSSVGAEVVAVVSLAAQNVGADSIRYLNNQHLLFVHGRKDSVVPP